MSGSQDSVTDAQLDTDRRWLPAMLALFVGSGCAALIYEVVFYVLKPDYNTYMDMQQSINFRLIEEFQKAGIEFAYPTQQLYVTTNEPV